MPVARIDELPADVLAFWAPPEKVPPAQWVTENVYLDNKIGAVPGYWSHTRFPYSRGVLELLDDRNVERIILNWGTRLGKTTLLGAFVAWLADNDPCAVCIGVPDQKMAHEHYRTKLDPILQACEAIERRRPPEHKRQMELVDLESMWVYYAWSGGKGTLSSRSIRVFLVNEVNLWQDKASNEGDPVSMALDRTKDYPNRKIIIEGKPTVEGECRITAAYEQSDQRRFQIPCYFCKGYQLLEFGTEDSKFGLKWERGPRGSDPDVARNTAYYQCQCGGKLYDRHKIPMLRKGVWVPKGQTVAADGKLEGTPERGPRIAGLHLSSLYSTALTWGECAEAWLRACKDPQNPKGKIHSYQNSWLSIAFRRESRKVTGEEIWKHSRGTNYLLGSVPGACLALLGTVDVQIDHFWFVIRAWGWNASSWLVHYGRAETWAALESVMKASTYEGANGELHTVKSVWVDSGFRTAEVYEECIKRRWVPIKGQPGRHGGAFLWELVAIKDRLKGFNIDSDAAFDKLYESRILISPDTPGYWHLPENIRGDYVRSLAGPKKESEVNDKGETISIWKKGDFSHLADCEKYQEAAAFKYGFAFKRNQPTQQQAPRLAGRAMDGPGGWGS
jgi:phage terminase large subunit GpA-like protein